MNIVTPIPTAIPFTTSNVSTESARRENVQRDVIPQITQAENAAAESGLGSESDRLRQSAKSAQPAQSPTYERPTVQQNPNSGADAAGLQNPNGDTPDNAQQESAGKENAEERQRQEQEAAEQREVDELKSRDREVRAHEQAHAAVGGQYAGSPSYDFETGPDGQQYAVGGEVSIDISKESDPSDTIDKMQQVRAAALAPSEPSPQDFRVASEANRLSGEARSELAQQQLDEQQENQEENFDRVFQQDPGQINVAGQTSNGSAQEIIDDQIPELDEIVEPGDIGSPTRSLERARLEEATLQENRDTTASNGASVFSGGILDALQTETLNSPQANDLFGQRNDDINQRALRISSFYQQTSTPRGPAGFQQTA